MNPSVSSSQTSTCFPGRDLPSQVLLCFGAHYGDHGYGGNADDYGGRAGLAICIPVSQVGPTPRKMYLGLWVVEKEADKHQSHFQTNRPETDDTALWADWVVWNEVHNQ